jgi:hypothetical protein
MEPLELKLTSDHDYVAHVGLFSTMRKHQLNEEIFNLEFTLRFPTSADRACRVQHVNGEKTDPRRGHQPAADLILAHDLKQLAVKHAELLAQDPAGDQ